MFQLGRSFAVLGVVVSALVVPFSASSASTSVSATAPVWQGTWSTNWGPLTLTGSDAALSGQFGYSDSVNEPLGRVTDGRASAGTLVGSWAHDPPSRYAPRDHGTFSAKIVVTPNGTVTFEGTATYVADGTSANFFGTCSSGSCAADTSAPTAKAYPAKGTAGKVISLRYRVTDTSGKVGETISVYRGSAVIWSRTVKLHSIRRDGTYTIAFKAPARPGALRFRVASRDAAGNKSAASIASLRVS